jgi:hypothetical protein
MKYEFNFFKSYLNIKVDNIKYIGGLYHKILFGCNLSSILG